MNQRKMNIKSHSLYVRESQDWYVSKGICCACKVNEVYNDTRKCLVCLMDEREKAAYYRQNIKPENKQKQAQRRKRRLDLCVAFGVCRGCQKRDVLTGHSYCEICLAKKRNKHISEINEKDIIPRYMRAELGLCYVCGKNLIVKDKRVCSDCLKTKQQAIKKCQEATNNSNHIWRKKDTVMYSYGKKHDERTDI